MLKWARKAANLSLDSAANKLGLKSSEKATKAEKLEEFENYTSHPTRNQLIKLAKIYDVKLTVFYLDNPPQNGDLGTDFRMFPRNVSPEEQSILNSILLDIYARSDYLRGVIEDEADASQISFIGSFNTDMDIKVSADRERSTLGIDERDWTKNYNNPTELFKDLRNKIEGLGVFVLLKSNLGSHHTNVGPEVFRGFAIADDWAPFIVINDQDAKTAYNFTLLHELMHLFLGTSGISAQPNANPVKDKRLKIETYCNDVTGELLLPIESFSDTLNLFDHDTAASKISEIAKLRNLSEPMVAYNIYRRGQLNDELFAQLKATFSKRWEIEKQRKKQNTKKSGGGPSYYVVHRFRLGNALMRLVGRSLQDNEITHTTAARLLGLSPGAVETLLKGVDGIYGSMRQNTEG